jgi:hypothetical protein
MGFLPFVGPLLQIAIQESNKYHTNMIRIRFPDAASERKALGYLAGRFSFTTRSDGVTLVPELALPALDQENIAFIVDGRASYEQIVSPLRNPPSAAV